MTTYQDIRVSRALIWAGIGIGYAVALTIAGLNLTSGEGTILTALAFLGILAIPPTLAILSLDRRPSLLTAASMAAVVQGVVLLTSVGLVELIPAILWTMAGQRRPRPPRQPRSATWVRPLLAAVAIVPLVVMFIHLDPRCTLTSADGEVISTSVDTSARTGWSLQLAGSSSSHTSIDGMTTSCTTNTIQPWEAAASIALSFAIVAGVNRRWPTAGELLEGDPEKGDRGAVPAGPSDHLV